MNTYNTYQEAKIANPDCDIYYYDGKFYAYSKDTAVMLLSETLSPCKPADHCMTVEEFLADGNKLIGGDLIMQVNGKVAHVDEDPDWNIKDDLDVDRHILRAAALNKTKRTKVEYVKVEFDQLYLAAKAVFDGEALFIGYVDNKGEPTGEYSSKVNQDGAACNYKHLYRRIETPMTEREAFVEACMDEAKKLPCSSDNVLAGRLFDSGKFKLVN